MVHSAAIDDNTRLTARTDGTFTDTTKRKKTFASPTIHRIQARHYLLFDVLPLVGVLGAVVLAYFVPVGTFEWTIMWSLSVVTGLGITSGFHRYFTHRTFEAKPWAAGLLQLLGCMAGQGGAISWACLHRRHHECSDTEGDPHSPNMHGTGFLNRARGLMHSHMTWMRKHDYPSIVHYVPDLLRDKQILKIDSYYYWIVISGLALPTLLGGLWYGSLYGCLAGLLWGGAVRIFVVEHTIWSINSILHVFGPRAFKTREGSRNSLLLSVFSLGESWHNNHHAFPGSAHFGLAWYRPDPGYWFIKLLAAFGGVRKIHVPAVERIRNFNQRRDETTNVN
jgi:stearoyl-CoA desaturase (Delta-9 desaturase)